MTRTAARNQFLADIMVTAAEGGSNYWCNFPNVDYDGLSLTCAWTETNDGSGPVSTRAVNADDIERAVKLIADGMTNVSSTNAGWIKTGSETNDASNVDSDAADCVLQVALFGELVFG